MDMEEKNQALTLSWHGINVRAIQIKNYNYSVPSGKLNTMPYHPQAHLVTRVFIKQLLDELEYGQSSGLVMTQLALLLLHEFCSQSLSSSDYL